MKLMDQQEFTEQNLFGLGVPNVEDAPYFAGLSFLNRLTHQESGMEIANVTFEPGGRNNWHIHHARTGGGQILMCMAGEGWYQEADRPPISLVAGMVISIPPEVRHWHGAKHDSWFSHLSIEIPGEETTVEWCEPVADEEYAKLEEK